MKKITPLALATLMMVGCAFKNNQDISKKIVILDSCEYIQYWTANYNMNIEHKGNCRFCKERRQKELEELITKLKEK